MRSRSIFKVGGAALAVAALGLTFAVPASADIAPNASDIVGVGSDTVQNMANFMADGDTSFSSLGVNSTVSKNRVFSFDATPDANDRAGYLQGSTALVPKPLTPTIVLRAGHNPVQRPNGSGKGIDALIADTGNQVNFVRMSSLPSVANQNAVTGGLRVIKISTDNLKLASATTTNVPAAGLDAATLAKIYTCTTGFTDWSSLGGSAGVIIPQAPDAINSGTGKTFFADLKAASGSSTYTYGSCVQTVEENDPTSITTARSAIGNLLDPADAIAPFSEGRFTLYASSYFHDSTLPFPTATVLTSGIKLYSGATNYLKNRGLFIVFRDSDKNSTVQWQPGNSLNWVQALFMNSNPLAPPYVSTTDGQAAIASGGGVPTYVNCGVGATVLSC